MSAIIELPAMEFDFAVHSTEQAWIWDRRWYAVTGVPYLSSCLDLRNVAVGAGAAISVMPAIQFAAKRTDRPDDGTLFTGTALSAAGIGRFLHTVSAADKFFFRRGIGVKLSSGSFARAQGLLYSSFTMRGFVLPTEEITFHPVNSTNDWSIFPLNAGKPIPTLMVDKAKLVVHGMGNANANLEYQAFARAYSDPMARGDWTALGTAATPGSGNFDGNTGELSLTALSLTSYEWLDLALGVRKNSGANPNSRCVIHVAAALKHT